MSATFIAYWPFFVCAFLIAIGFGFGIHARYKTVLRDDSEQGKAVYRWSGINIVFQIFSMLIPSVIFFFIVSHWVTQGSIRSILSTSSTELNWLFPVIQLSAYLLYIVFRNPLQQLGELFMRLGFPRVTWDENRFFLKILSYPLVTMPFEKVRECRTVRYHEAKRIVNDYVGINPVRMIHLAKNDFDWLAKKIAYPEFIGKPAKREPILLLRGDDFLYLLNLKQETLEGALHAFQNWQEKGVLNSVVSVA